MVDGLNIKLTETKNNTLLNKFKTLMKTHGETVSCYCEKACCRCKLWCNPTDSHHGIKMWNVATHGGTKYKGPCVSFAKFQCSPM